MRSLHPLYFRVDLRLADYVWPEVRRILRAGSLYFFLGVTAVYALAEEPPRALLAAAAFFGFDVLLPLIELARIAWLARSKRTLLLTIDDHGVALDGDLMTWKEIIALDDEPRALVVSGRRLFVLSKRSLSAEQLARMERWFDDRLTPEVNPLKRRPARFAMFFVGLALLSWAVYRAISEGPP